MKKTRKLMSLLMAMAVMLSVAVMPVAAAVPEEAVEPCAVYHICGSCGAEVKQVKVLVATRSVTRTSCDEIKDTSHTHTLWTYDVYDDCPNCGRTYIKTTTEETCNGQ